MQWQHYRLQHLSDLTVASDALHSVFSQLATAAVEVEDTAHVQPSQTRKSTRNRGKTAESVPTTQEVTASEQRQQNYDDNSVFSGVIYAVSPFSVTPDSVAGLANPSDPAFRDFTGK